MRMLIVSCTGGGEATRLYGAIMEYEPLLTDVEAAKFLGGLHPKTVQRMARRGEIPAYRIGKFWRFRASELDEWLRVQSRPKQ